MEPKPMTSDEGRRTEAWWHLRARLAHGPNLGLPLPPYCAGPVVLTGIDFAKDDSGGSNPNLTGARPRFTVVDDIAGSTHDAGATCPAIATSPF